MHSLGHYQSKWGKIHYTGYTFRDQRRLDKFDKKGKRGDEHLYGSILFNDGVIRNLRITAKSNLLLILKQQFLFTKNQPEFPNDN